MHIVKEEPGNAKFNHVIYDICVANFMREILFTNKNMCLSQGYIYYHVGL